MIPGESVHSPLPWDLPWWMPDHTIFFGALYLVIFFIGAGLVFALLKTLRDVQAHGDGHSAGHH